LLPFIISTSETGTAVSTHRINFIDEDNARCIFLPLLKHVTHTRGADANKHFNKIGA
jgi:hypothetical protein